MVAAPCCVRRATSMEGTPNAPRAAGNCHRCVLACIVNLTPPSPSHSVRSYHNGFVNRLLQMQEVFASLPPHTSTQQRQEVSGLSIIRTPRRSAFISRSGSHAHSGGARRRRDTTCTPRAPPLQRHAPRRTVAPTPWAVASEPGRGCALTSGTS